ncbi:Six-hairpin glycosidase [Dendrothele bispora CBS 962.96]|uniref:Six-hairpin glycosidase n=1 Tax=Dendrothele bispora (strain CBS 962.96) TaxID=1314807 RepID=A0A4S8MRG2_DENBC|nr:Six-hairpin glycosidase [Dendrothele bispora CBS 962.96]
MASKLLSFLSTYLVVVNASLDSSAIASVRQNLLNSATLSWELGTAAEALLELECPTLSVFNQSAFPPPYQLNDGLNITDVVNIANNVLAAKTTDSLPLIDNDGAVGDPASVGVAVLLANWTKSDLTNTAYSTAAGNQLNYLLNVAPRTASGAISHRADEAQLWADFVYMAPPFIAYFGSLQGGDGETSLLQIAYEQCSLYRDGLRDEGGLWRHVAQGSWQDNTHWATGNGWAAAGMLRVLETLNHTSQAQNFVDHRANLTSWIEEIILAAWQHQSENGTLLNVIDDPSSFADSAGTALLAYVTYRMANYTGNGALIPYANKALRLVEDSIDSEGWLRNTVNPYTFNTPSTLEVPSPEGQAFVLLLHSAWRDANMIESNAGDGDSNGDSGNDGDNGDDTLIAQKCRLVRRR